jgi:hypothetical protein
MTGEVHHFTTAALALAARKPGELALHHCARPPSTALSAHALMQRLELGRRRGFGAIKVRIRIGESQWDVRLPCGATPAGPFRSAPRSARPKPCPRATWTRYPGF